MSNANDRVCVIMLTLVVPWSMIPGIYWPSPAYVRQWLTTTSPQDLRPGTSPPAAGTGPATAPGRGNLARVLNRALCDLRQSQLQVRPRTTARPHLVFDRDLRPGPHHWRHYLR